MRQANQSEGTETDPVLKGTLIGRQLGWSHGYHLGRCESILRQIQPAPKSRTNIKVLYIPQGFPAMDRGLIQALEQSVREVIVGKPHQMLILAEQARPDLVLVVNGLHTFPEDHLYQITRIREIGVRTLIWFTEDPFFTDETMHIAPHYDVVLTNEQNCVSFYAGLGCRQVAFLPLAADTERFRPQYVEPKYRSDLCFIGKAFWNRASFFDRIAPYLSNKKIMMAGGLWERLTRYDLLQHRIHNGEIPLDEVIKYFIGAKIVINLHRQPAHETDNKNKRGIPAMSINSRTYEMAACGTLQLTDRSNDYSYASGKEIVTFDSPEDFIAKAEYYLTHEEERQAIALNGLRRTLRQHSYLSRVGEFMELIGY